MDDDTEELIEHLCCRIGMIMEDAAAAALTTGRAEAEARSAAISELEAAAARINGLVGAIKALLD